MVAIQIRDVPNETRDQLVAIARSRGQSLQGYLMEVINREVGFERNRALLDEIREWADGSGTGGTLEDVLRVIDEGRASRWSPLDRP